MECELYDGLFPYIECRCPPSDFVTSPNNLLMGECLSFPESLARVIKPTIRNHPWQSKDRKAKPSCDHVTVLKSCELCALTYPDLPKTPKKLTRKYIGIDTTHTPCPLPTPETKENPSLIGKELFLPIPDQTRAIWIFA